MVSGRIVANIIQPKMGMDGLNTRAHWSLIGLKRGTGSSFDHCQMKSESLLLFCTDVLVILLRQFPSVLLVEIPRAFVCAESKIFDVSEWTICQGMACRPNTHRPSFHVNMVGLERKSQRCNSSRYQWDLDAEMVDEEEEFELWLQQALASGLFCETSKRRKSWSPFKLHQLKGKKQWRRASS
ncbi:uncharacterized protein LOC115665326 isoform X2 [Syzygium oleosum]|uniref:uncharacterized protein LOC115665326 isoform X2 n=1 Tax=Syzygium oleosum TaxID=219896 RepID=UPI0024BA82C2|nr:uncharacterized protein LOC115665326 isoform X2 [Syzygium oleosum]